MATRNLWRPFLLALLLVWPFRVPVTAASVTYTDPNGRFSFTVPEGYSVQRLPAFSPDAPGTTVVSSLLRGDAGVTITLTRSAAVGNGSATPAGTGNSQSVPVGGQPARSFDSSIDGGRGPIHDRTLLVSYGRYAYRFFFQAGEADYDALLAETQILRDSFVFLDDGTAAATDTPATSGSDDLPIIYPYQLIRSLGSANARVVLLDDENQALHLRVDCLRAGDISDASVRLLFRVTGEEIGTIGPFARSCGDQRTPIGEGSFDLTSVAPGKDLTLVQDYTENWGSDSQSPHQTVALHMGTDGHLRFGNSPTAVFL